MPFAFVGGREAPDTRGGTFAAPPKMTWAEAGFGFNWPKMAVGGLFVTLDQPFFEGGLRFSRHRLQRGVSGVGLLSLRRILHFAQQHDEFITP